MQKIRYGDWYKTSDCSPYEFFEDEYTSRGYYLVWVGEVGEEFTDEVFVTWWSGYTWNLPYDSLSVIKWMFIRFPHWNTVQRIPPPDNDDII